MCCFVNAQNIYIMTAIAMKTKSVTNVGKMTEYALVKYTNINQLAFLIRAHIWLISHFYDDNKFNEPGI